MGSQIIPSEFCKASDAAETLIGAITNPVIGELAGKGVDYLYDNAAAPTAANLQRGKERVARNNANNMYGAGTAESSAVADPDVMPQDEQMENEDLASEAGKAARKKRKKTGTSHILTTPLGATETAKTAVSKLGGR
jgi:hypothetical protein